MNFQEQTILITGGAGNFGAFLCEYCLNSGAAKVLLTDIDAAKLDIVQSRFPQIDTFVCDLTDSDAVKSMLAQISEKHKVTVLVNNAGLIHSEPLVNLFNKEQPFHSFETWDKTIRLNLYTCFNMGAQMASFMARSRTKGVIINISSIAAQGNLGQTAYSAAKAGIEAMTKTWAKELGMFKIRVVSIAPGFINTDSTHESLSESVVEKWKKQVPLNQLGDVKHIGDTVKFIVENDYINGKNIPVDGGLVI